MSNLFARYETDQDKERKGVPVIIDGATFYLRRAGGHNRAYRYALATAARSFVDVLKGAEQNPQAAFDAQDDITQQAFAEAVIIGWEGVDGRDGQPLEFSKENFLDLVRSCAPVWDLLREAAIDDDRFKATQEDAKQLGE